MKDTIEPCKTHFSFLDNLRTKIVRTKAVWTVLALLTVPVAMANEPFRLDESGVFHKQGVDVMMYNDSYNSGGFFDEKVNGIEMIQHGVRTVTGGAVRLSPTPEQWDLTPTVKERSIDAARNKAEVTLYYKEYDFTSKLRVEAKGEGCLLTVTIDKPVPKALEGKAGLNIEFIPSSYFKKTYLMDDRSGIFPQYPTGPMMADPFSEKIPQFGNLLTNERFGDTYAKTLPMASGKSLVLSPDDETTLVTLRSQTGEIGLLDGRNLAPNGWFVVRELLPAGKTGPVVQWMLTPNAVKAWRKDPVLSHSQVGYHPDQEKVAVIELDPMDKPLSSATLVRVGTDGSETVVFSGMLSAAQKFFRYSYHRFDFSAVRAPGVYRIRYGRFRSEPFLIGKEVYADSWHPTLDTWFPVQMDHMFVKEAYRIWHSNSHMDDALQAPTDTLIHDGYRMGNTTDTKYKPYEHIPGLNVGGWYDAGDFDIQTGSHIETLLYLAGLWEDIRPTRDENLVDKDRKYVLLHHPDGKPDLLQQIEHGTLALVAQHRAIGHAIRGIVQSRLFQYNAIGDAGSLTDQLVYNPKLKPFQMDGRFSGTMDDRWAFTNYNPSVNLQSAITLAAVSRALRPYNDSLAAASLSIAQGVWKREVTDKATDGKQAETTGPVGPGGFRRGLSSTTEARAAAELFLSTGDEQYVKHFSKVWPSVRAQLDNPRGFGMGANQMRSFLRMMPHLDEAYRNDLKAYAGRLKVQMDSVGKSNPFGVPIGPGGFYTGGNYTLVNWALTAALMHQDFPDIIGTEYAIRGLDYLLGCHPISSLSFVSGVGVNSKRVTYGNNRADFTCIPGGVVPGLYLIKPDYYENKEDWPFIWYENEVVVDCCAAYISLAATVEHMLSNP